MVALCYWEMPLQVSKVARCYWGISLQLVKRIAMVASRWCWVGDVVLCSSGMPLHGAV